MSLPRLHKHPWMTSELDEFRTQVRRFIEGEMAPHLEQWRKNGAAPRDFWLKFGEMGFLLPEMPEQYGGSGVSASYQLVVQDEIARVEGPPTTCVHSLVSHYILDYGTEEQKSKWLTKMVTGEHLAAIGLTEPGCGSDLKALRTRAVRDGDHYVINGSKTFITNGSTCSLLVLACRTGGEGAKGVSLIVLETEKLKGFNVGRRLEKIGMHASDTCELSFEDVRVPVSNLLGPEEGHGFMQLMSQLPYERLIIGVPAASVIDRAFEITNQYVKDRKAFGQTIADFQNTKFKLAEIATIAHVVRTFVNDAIQRFEDGALDDEVAYMIKWWTTEQQCKVVDECLQLFGGYGFMTEYPIARMYVDSRAQRIYGGSNEVMKDLISRKL